MACTCAVCLALEFATFLGESGDDPERMAYAPIVYEQQHPHAPHSVYVVAENPPSADFSDVGSNAQVISPVGIASAEVFGTPGII
jgi:hypothetical protein